MKKTKTFISLQFTERSSAELRGRQSVRTTFRLSERCIDALSILAGQMGIKQKSLFDHLVDDPQALATIAREFESFPTGQSRVAKTYVVSRKTLENLERVAARYNTPRDVLVEFSIERILPLIEQEKEKHKKRKAFASRLADLLNQSGGLLGEARAELGPDDPVVREMEAMLHAGEVGFGRIHDFLARGERIEDF